MSICNNCKHHNKKHNLCTMGYWQSNTEDTKQPLDRCEHASKAKKVTRDEA